MISSADEHMHIQSIKKNYSNSILLGFYVTEQHKVAHDCKGKGTFKLFYNKIPGT